ncbi:ferric iron uptake transcriptional regulator [Gammaproteobacteria bacterium]|nr:ferric iron uptake transcriptional regulator [Gammaproteobacteria bacterium]
MSSENKELRKVGLKVTLPRVKILQILENSENKHMSAEDVYKALIEGDQDVGLATVYRVLTQFEAAGLVTRHHFEGGHSVFEVDSGDHHDHLVCMETGAVIEFQNDTIERLQEQIAKELGYELVDHNLVLYGKPKS